MKTTMYRTFFVSFIALHFSLFFNMLTSNVIFILSDHFSSCRPISDKIYQIGSFPLGFFPMEECIKFFNSVPFSTPHVTCPLGQTNLLLYSGIDSWYWICCVVFVHHCYFQRSKILCILIFMFEWVEFHKNSNNVNTYS